MSEVEKLISIAKAEVGYREKSSNNNLDDKTANVGSNNYNKYARDLDNIKDFYNTKKNGYSWCDIFVDWCFVQAFGVNRALELLCQTKKSCGAGCVFSMQYFKNKGQFFSKPKIGDQIFFKDSDGDAGHTGLVYGFDNYKVYTIEGNSNNKVEMCSYDINSSSILGYGRPKYNEECKEEPKTEVKQDTKKENVKKLQQALNKDYNCGLDVDGIIGPLTTKAVNNNMVRNFTVGEFAKWVQERLIAKGYSLNEFGVDGRYGNESEKKVKEFQANCGIDVDGIVGINTVNRLI